MPNLITELESFKLKEINKNNTFECENRSGKRWSWIDYTITDSGDSNEDYSFYVINLSLIKTTKLLDINILREVYHIR